VADDEREFKKNYCYGKTTHRVDTNIFTFKEKEKHSFESENCCITFPENVLPGVGHV